MQVHKKKKYVLKLLLKVIALTTSTFADQMEDATKQHVQNIARQYCVHCPKLVAADSKKRSLMYQQNAPKILLVLGGLCTVQTTRDVTNQGKINNVVSPFALAKKRARQALQARQSQQHPNRVRQVRRVHQAHQVHQARHHTSCPLMAVYWLPLTRICLQLVSSRRTVGTTCRLCTLNHQTSTHHKPTSFGRIGSQANPMMVKSQSIPCHTHSSSATQMMVGSVITMRQARTTTGAKAILLLVTMSTISSVLMARVDTATAADV